MKAPYCQAVSRVLDGRVSSRCGSDRTSVQTSVGTRRKTVISMETFQRTTHDPMREVETNVHEPSPVESDLRVFLSYSRTHLNMERVCLGEGTRFPKPLKALHRRYHQHPSTLPSTIADNFSEGWVKHILFNICQKNTWEWKNLS